MVNKLEKTSKNEKFYDYCYYEYKPNSVFFNKLNSSNLLFNSFKNSNCSSKFYDFVKLIRNHFGINRTVFGVKLIDNKLYWEFYFYNWMKKNNLINITNFFKICKSVFQTKIEMNENVPYFMFSVDVTENLLLKAQLDGIHVYIDGSYLLSENGFILENHYNFYNPFVKINELINDIKTSVFVDFEKIDLSEILWPELINCYSICRARKKSCDCVYFSRVNIDQFLFFLKKIKYPNNLIDFIVKNKLKLDHLLFDVGFDYVMENNKLKIIKSGYYGIF
jgi:hypothetical protein